MAHFISFLQTSLAVILCHPFGAWRINVLCFFTGLHPVLIYASPLGLWGKHIVFLHRAASCAILCHPFGAWRINVLCFYTGLHPVLLYVSPLGLVGWRWLSCIHRFTGLHPVLIYVSPLGLFLLFGFYQFLLPIVTIKYIFSISPPRRMTYISGGCSPLKRVQPTVIKKQTFI